MVQARTQSIHVRPIGLRNNAHLLIEQPMTARLTCHAWSHDRWISPLIWYDVILMLILSMVCVSLTYVHNLTKPAAWSNTRHQSRSRCGNYDALQLEGCPTSRLSFWAVLAKFILRMRRNLFSSFRSKFWHRPLHAVTPIS